MSAQFILAHATARSRALAYVAEAPAGWVVSVKPQTRSLEANAKLHAELQEVAESIPWAGKKRDVETWKRLLVAAWLRARGEPIELLPAIDGHGVDVVFRRTSELTRPEMSELLEFVLAWKAEHITEQETA